MTPGAAQVVLGGNVRYDVPEGQRVMVTKLCFGVTTVSDDCDFELGQTDAAGAGGTFVARTLPFHVATGAAVTGRTTYTHDFNPPLPFEHRRGVRTITYRVNANDATCQIRVAWFGWYEDE